MVETNKPKRRNNVNKRLDSAAIKKREREAEKRNIPRLKDLSLAINQRLLDLGKNQEWLVDETGIGKATISAYYNAESMPNGANLIKLADVLETTPNYLLGYTDTPTADIEIQAIHEKIGLTEDAIKILMQYEELLPTNDYASSLSKLIEGFIFNYEVVEAIPELLIAAENDKAIRENKEEWISAQTDFVKKYDKRAALKANEKILLNTQDFYKFIRRSILDGLDAALFVIIEDHLEKTNMEEIKERIVNSKKLRRDNLDKEVAETMNKVVKKVIEKCPLKIDQNSDKAID